MAARGLDARLKVDRHQTVCHGDAKDCNMLFAPDKEIGMYDFQYCGKAPCMKDLAYCNFCAMGSFWGGDWEREFFDFYIDSLMPKLASAGVPRAEMPVAEKLWDTYNLACCDLGRWMSGWGWWGNSDALKQRCEITLDRLDGGQLLGSEEEYTTRIFEVYPP